MPLKVIGAGLGRTGTFSLKLALEQLLGQPCYHMVEVRERPEHVPLWHAAARGEGVDWPSMMDGYCAAVDWPASAYWAELSEVFPEAIIVLSERSPDSWWASASETIFPAIKSNMGGERNDWYEMVMEMLARSFTDRLDDREVCMEAFANHNAKVRRTAPADRLVTWSAADGWAPLCAALRLPIPDAPFPRANTKEEFNARRAAAAAEPGIMK